MFSVSCANPQAYNDHIAGKAHKRKEELAKGNGNFFFDFFTNFTW